MDDESHGNLLWSIYHRLFFCLLAASQSVNKDRCAPLPSANSGPMERFPFRMWSSRWCNHQTKTYQRVFFLFWESFPLIYQPTFQVWPFNIHTRTEWLMSFLINGFKWKEGSLIKPFSQVTARSTVKGAPGSHWPHQHKGTIYFHWYSRCCFTYFSSDPKHMLPCFYSMYHRILFRVICAWQVKKYIKFLLTFRVSSARWKLIHHSRIQDQKTFLFIKCFDLEAVSYLRYFENTY